MHGQRVAAHAERTRALSDFATDPPEAEQPKRRAIDLIRELCTPIAVCPDVLAELAIGVEELAAQRHKSADDPLGDRLLRATGIHERCAGRQGRPVDALGAGPGADEQSQIWA